MTAAVLTKIVTYRDRMRDRWSPPWLATGNNEKLLYAIALLADVCGDAMTAALAMRFPGLYSYESLPVIGRERRITRGPYETDAGYASRLRRWLDDHRRRGGPYAMLAQLHAYFAPNNFPIELVYRSGRRFVMALDGTVARSVAATFAPDARPEQHARWWLFYTTDDYDTPDLSTEDRADIAHVPREWNNARCIGTVVVMPPGSETWGWPLGRKWNRHVKWNNPARGAKVMVDNV